MMLQENIQPSAPANRFKAADTSCLTERCNSSCMSMHASSILCMLLIPCRSLPMSVLKSLIASHSCKKTQPNKFPRMNFSCSHNNTRYPSKFKNRGITANIIPHLMITTSPFSLITLMDENTIFFLATQRHQTINDEITHGICMVYPVSAAPIVMTQFSVP